MIDSHAHLNDPRFGPDRPEVLRRAREAGATAIVNVGFDLPSSLLAIEIAQREPDCWAAVGIHPHEASAVDDEALAALAEMARQPRIVAIGETGLDFYRNLSPPEVQAEAFASLIRLAAEVQLPLVVHCRDAQEQCLEVLDANLAPGQRVVMHCFAGGTEFAGECLQRGFWLGIAGTVTYPKAFGLRQVAKTAPADRLLVESDCPWLPPQGRRGQRNEPAYVADVVEQVARERGMGVAEAASLTAANAAALFGIE